MKIFIYVFACLCFELVCLVRTFGQPSDYADYYPFSGNTQSAVYGGSSTF